MQESFIGLHEVLKSDGLDGAKLAGAAKPAVSSTGTTGSLLTPEVRSAAIAGEPALESDLPKHDNIGSLLTPEARVAATAGESVGINGLHQVLESARSSLFHGSSLARSCAVCDESCAAGVASVSAASGVAALPARRSLTYARAAANACGEVARGSNSCSDTAINSLRVQRATSYTEKCDTAARSETGMLSRP